MGSVTEALRSFPLKAMAKEIGPTLPMYIVAIIIILETVLRLAVRFLDKPTVAVALTVSYIMSVNAALLKTESKRVDVNTMTVAVAQTARAFLSDLPEMRRLNTDVSFLPVITEKVEKIMIKNVTVLIPPAVPTGEPPINMRNREIIVEGSVRFSWGIEANPAVLVVTDWKKLA